MSGGQDGQLNLVAGGAARGAGVGGSRLAGAFGGGGYNGNPVGGVGQLGVRRREEGHASSHRW